MSLDAYFCRGIWLANVDRRMMAIDSRIKGLGLCLRNWLMIADDLLKRIILNIPCSSIIRIFEIGQLTSR